MAKDIYVGNLSSETTSADLKAVFGQYGTVYQAHVATHRDTGRSRGFGFVEMGDGAEQAIQALNGARLQGHTLAVCEAEPHRNRANASAPALAG